MTGGSGSKGRRTSYRPGETAILRGWSLELTGRPEEGLRDIEEALELERMLGQSEGEATCLVLRSEVLVTLGRPDEGKEGAVAAATLLRRLGVPEWLAHALRVLGEAEDAAGNLKAAEDALREAVETATGMPMAYSIAASSLAAELVRLGDLASAEEYARRSLAAGVPCTAMDARLVLAEIGLLRGDPGAEAMAAEAVGRAQTDGYVFRPILRRLKVTSPQAVQSRRPVTPAAERHRRTFVFTDMVRSTNLVEAMGDEAWDQLLRWHDETLRSLFRSHRGEEVNRIGDGFFVAFEEAKPAADCARAIQQALARHRLEHGFAPQVRIGLHEAEATRKGNDYQGKGVHLAARIAALANGGEILASRPVAAHLGRLALSDVRTVKLKGFSEPVDVVSIDWQ